MSLSLKDIAGLNEFLDQSRELETATREEAWIGVTRLIAGRPIRVMTVQDYTALMQFENPMINRQLPSPDEFAFFLWVLSPEVERWHRREGWRSLRCLRRIERWQSRRHGAAVRRAIDLAQLEQDEAAWHAKAKGVPLQLPDEHPFAIAIKEAFEYIDEMFLDRPASLKRDGSKSGLCYLTSWFDMMQSEYRLPTAEIWEMPLTILFARIKAIQRRRGMNVPDFSEERDKLMQKIMLGLNQKQFTEDDLRAGRVDLEKLCNN